MNPTNKQQVQTKGYEEKMRAQNNQSPTFVKTYKLSVKMDEKCSQLVDFRLRHDKMILIREIY